jgi:predicted ATP-grasp superfamily ATP-dependent carboligase
MPRNSDPFLIAALSGRALMQSAQRGGMPVVVLDVFADMEVRRAAGKWAQVGNCVSGMQPEQLLAAADSLAPPGNCAGLVYGSGFESDPDLLARLTSGRELFGNSPETLAQICEPHRFFPVLDRLGLPHPDVRYEVPVDSGLWLAKRAGACGGGHVMPACRVSGADSYYYQRRVNGEVVSVLFLGNGREARILGVSEQWQSGPGSRHPYLYSGAVSHRRLGRALFAEIRLAIGDMVRWWQLRGLNGLDLVVRGQDFDVLELNARPTATVELYQSAYRGSLFDSHVQACRGKLVSTRPETGRRHAHMPVFAAGELRVPPAFGWPAWCSDLPAPGICIRYGEPLCSVHATGKDTQAMRALLLERAGRLHKALLPDWAVIADTGVCGE